MITHRYSLWMLGPMNTPVSIARLAIKESNQGNVSKVQFEYRPSYLEKPWAFSINPVELPLESRIFEFNPSQNSLPGFVDDLLPDRWGRAVIARYLLWSEKIKVQETNHCDILNHLPSSFIGALKAQPVTSQSGSEHPLFDAGIPVSSLKDIRDPSDLVRDQASDADRFGLYRLAQGSGLGGARPKVLCYDDDGYYLAKFSKPEDPFDMIASEAACLEMARDSGLSTPDFKIMDNLFDGRRALLVSRFDISGAGFRKHLITANALLKESGSCEDLSQALASYDDIVRLIRKYGSSPAEDLKQLFGQMLFNDRVNNRDDHLRNFSFFCDQSGLKLTPSYDIVPSETVGQYSFLRFKGRDALPGCEQAGASAKAFSLSLELGQKIGDRIRKVTSEWPSYFKKHGASAKDLSVLKRVMPRLPNVGDDYPGL